MYKRVWVVTIEVNFFETKIFIEATEERLRKYIDSELNGIWKSCRGAREEEVKAAKEIGMKVYLY